MPWRWLAWLVVGIAAVRGDDVFLGQVGDVWRYQAAFAEVSVPPTAWREAGFDDSAWAMGRSGFSAGYSPPEATDLPVPFPSPVATYFRRAFLLPQPAQVKWLTLRIEYCDGFVAFLNGQEIARSNLAGAPGSLVPFNQPATNYNARGQPVELDVTGWTNALVAGTNVLAVQVHSASASLVGLCFSAELLANFNRAPYVQNVSSNHVQIIWKTPHPADTRVAFGLDTAVSSVQVDTNRVTTHVVTLTNLVADHEYAYRASSGVGDEIGGVAGTFHTFKTAGPLSFIAVGDMGWNSVPQYELADVIRKTAPDFVLGTGDNVYPSFTRALVDPRIFSVYHKHMATTPYFFVIGNHDLYDGPGAYLEAFYLPTNSVSWAEHVVAQTSPEDYYSFDAGDAHFSMLFVPYVSQYKLNVGDTQYRWLTNDLAGTRQPWKIVVWHVPMNSSSGHRFDDLNENGIYDRLEIRDVLLPVLSQYGVQLVLCGHEHGYERFVPTNGVHAITTAGGGVELYAFTELDSASALFWPRYNCVQVNINGDTLTAQALDPLGAVFDSMTIQRKPPAPVLHRAAWHTPRFPHTLPNDSNGNIAGQTFDLRGEPILATTGRFSNLGRAFVNNDGTNLYIGFDQVTIAANHNVFLFIAAPGAHGVTNLLTIGDGRLDPAGQGADGLDCLANLAFAGFAPTVGCILGDQFADGQYRAFVRTNLALNIGQGAFHLDKELSDVQGLELQQFHTSPETPGLPCTTSAQFIQVGIPFSELGGVQPGDTVRIGAVVAGAEFDSQCRTRLLDEGFLGNGLAGSGMGAVVLEGLRVELAVAPQLDPALRLGYLRLSSGTIRLSWGAVPDRRFLLEVASQVDGPFLEISGGEVPINQGATNLTYDVELDEPIAADRFYRVRSEAVSAGAIEP